MSTFKYFRSSLVVAIVGLIAGFFLGYQDGGAQGALNALFLTTVLAVLEISLSFDNAVVNATVLEEMSPKWRRRFLTWGILVAVFGMRLLFPLLIVSVIGKISPWAAIELATFHPDEYARIMTSSHIVLAGFGGAFLLNVALKFFLDAHKNIHWMTFVERPLTRLGLMPSFDLALSLAIVYGISTFLPLTEQLPFLVAALFGAFCFVGVEGLNAVLRPSEAAASIETASLAMFVYLEILDATFSFDGVVGAFALTHNLFLIAIGLGIGAMFVRSLTILMTEKKTLTTFVFLEHGAFYAIGALSILMLLNVLTPIPEWFTGLIGAVVIGLSMLSSIRVPQKEVE
jgi:uncharacterized protein